MQRVEEEKFEVGGVVWLSLTCPRNCYCGTGRYELNVHIQLLSLSTTLVRRYGEAEDWNPSLRFQMA